MAYFDIERSAELVDRLCGQHADPRLRTIIGAIVRHLHAAIKETQLSPDEWMRAILLLTRAGKKCDDARQEFILLSDILGVSALVDALAALRPPGATENTVLGPFHVNNATRYANGADIRLTATGAATLVRGRVTDMHGTPVAGANVDVWQADHAGFYDVQCPADIPQGNLRGQFTSDDDGYYWFVTSKPRHYPIPCDGPVGELLKDLDRPSIRPAHIHFIVSASGYEPVITHYFSHDCPFLEQDPVLGVKASLIANFRPFDAESDHAIADVPGIEWVTSCNFVLVQRGGHVTTPES